MPAEGSTAKIFQEILRGYFLDGRKLRLKYIDAPFNIRNDKAGMDWVPKLDKKLEGSKGCVLLSNGRPTWVAMVTLACRAHGTRLMIFVLTHSNDDTGNLMLSPKPGRYAGSMEEVCGVLHCDLRPLRPSKKWFDAVFTPTLRSLITQCDTTVAFLSCGALVRTRDTLQSLVDHTTRYVGCNFMAAHSL